MTKGGKDTPCFSCILPREVEGKKPFPFFGCTQALIASLQVMEAIKLRPGFGELLTGKMLYANGELMEFIITPLQIRHAGPTVEGIYEICS